MTLTVKCIACQALQSPLNPFTVPRFAAGMVIGGDRCADERACMARRARLTR